MTLIMMDAVHWVYEKFIEMEFEVEVFMDMLEVTIDHHVSNEDADVKDSGAIAVRPV